MFFAFVIIDCYFLFCYSSLKSLPKNSSFLFLTNVTSYSPVPSGGLTAYARPDEGQNEFESRSFPAAVSEKMIPLGTNEIRRRSFATR